MSSNCAGVSEVNLGKFKADSRFLGFDSRPGVRVPAGTGNFSLHHRVQTGSEAHPASYSMGTRGSFPGRRAAGT
jgi:hypothetical protein